MSLRVLGQALDSIRQANTGRVTIGQIPIGVGENESRDRSQVDGLTRCQF